MNTKSVFWSASGHNTINSIKTHSIEQLPRSFDGLHQPSKNDRELQVRFQILLIINYIYFLSNVYIVEQLIDVFFFAFGFFFSYFKRATSHCVCCCFVCSVFLVREIVLIEHGLSCDFAVELIQWYNHQNLAATRFDSRAKDWNS